MSHALHFGILHCAGKAAKAVAIKSGACLAFALMIVVPGQSMGQDAYLAPCKDQLHMWQQDPSLRDKISGSSHQSRAARRRRPGSGGALECPGGRCGAPGVDRSALARRGRKGADLRRHPLCHSQFAIAVVARPRCGSD
mgnify:CR=1 FL=1